MWLACQRASWEPREPMRRWVGLCNRLNFPLSTASFLHPDERKDYPRDREDSSNDHRDDPDDFVNPYLRLLASNVFEEEGMPIQVPSCEYKEAIPKDEEDRNHSINRGCGRHGVRRATAEKTEILRPAKQNAGSQDDRGYSFC